MITRMAALAVAIIVAGLLSWLWPRIDRPPTRFEVARHLLDNGRPQDAALLFEDPMWRGVAQYRAGRYERALGDFYSYDAPSALTLYNLGVTHARMREWTHAAAHFDKVLRLDPEHADARHNLDIALKAIAMARSQTGENPRELPLDQEGDDKPEPSAYEQKNPSPAPPGEAEQQEPVAGEQAEEQDGNSEAPGELGDDERTKEKGSAVAYGEPGQQAERLERETHRSTLLKARESAQAAEILLRHIQDDPKKVLRARFYRAHQARKAAGQP
jgi:Ca-activated chloride channel family protein